MTTSLLSETELINRTRLDLFSGPATTRLVATIAERKRSQSRKRPRIIAIGRSANGQPFQVIAPPDDFAEAVAEVIGHRGTVRFSAETLAEIENEKIGAEICQAPWQW
jgi:hypothetical protein